jgi:GTP pyrophosphokinase
VNTTPPSITGSNSPEKTTPTVLKRVRELTDHILGEPPKSAWLSASGCAQIVAELGLGEEAIMAAAIVPLVTGHPLWLEAIEKCVPEAVRKLLHEVAELEVIDQLDNLAGAPQSEEQNEKIRRLLLAMVNDPRGVIVKLGIQLQWLRDAKQLSLGERQHLAQITQKIYAPLANRLGVWQLKWEMEDLSFRYLHPKTYKEIAGSLAERRVDRERYMEQTVAKLEVALASGKISADVKGRPKHIYSIWKKMVAKQLRFDELYDVRAVRVIVDDIPTCYSTLGVVHSLWTPIPSEFDDYIGSPKGNNYRSLHTAVRGPRGLTVEVQIRTQEMHDHAELGVAAHWRYKENTAEDSSFDQKISWLRNVIDEANRAEDRDLLQTVSQEVFNERVYIITPRGQVIDMPAGSTAIDFAYRIHTDIGHRCRGAKVNGHIVPLTYQLQNGDTVVVLTASRTSSNGPSRDWLNSELGYTVTAKARGRIRQWFKSQNQEVNTAAGKHLLEREIHRLGLDKPQEKSGSGIRIDKLVKHYNHTAPETLMASIGAGDITAAQLSSTLQKLFGPDPEEREFRPFPDAKDSPAGEIIVQGVGSLMNTLARCCRPVPGDPISGFVTKGRGVSIHRADCSNMLRLAVACPEREVEVTWGSSKNTYPVDIKIEAYDRFGLLRDITSVLFNDSVNVHGITSETDKRKHRAIITVTVEITGLEELSKIINRLIQIPNIDKAWRA